MLTRCSFFATRPASSSTCSKADDYDSDDAWIDKHQCATENDDDETMAEALARVARNIGPGEWILTPQM